MTPREALEISRSIPDHTKKECEEALEVLLENVKLIELNRQALAELDIKHGQASIRLMQSKEKKNEN